MAIDFNTFQQLTMTPPRPTTPDSMATVFSDRKSSFDTNHKDEDSETESLQYTIAGSTRTSGDTWSMRKGASTTSLPLNLLFNRDGGPAPAINTRARLIKLLGPDSIPHTMEISSIPCAGVKLGPGSLEGLVAWRLVVRLGGPNGALAHEKAVVVNFLLDTGRGVSTVSPEVLRALDYAGSIRPGQAVNLVIQGVKTRCVVAEKGDASRVATSFMISGSLSFYFDVRLNAPILHVENDVHKPRLLDIPRTVQPNIYNKVLTVLGKLAARSRGE